jgi:hypothetical protein
MPVPFKFATETLRQVEKPSDVPPGKSYIIQFHDTRTVHHEGDERSRTNPGHGYPAYSESFQEVTQFVTLDETEWKNAIEILSLPVSSKYVFVAFVAHRPEIKTSVHVSIG